MTKMFPFITQTWNPLGGECLHNCSYCWAKGLIKKNKMQKYTGKPTLIDKEMCRNFKEDDTVFVCDMTDLFGDWVPSEIIDKVLDKLWTGVHGNSFTEYLLLTKNPKRYLEFAIPDNCIAGATIECDMNFQVDGKAPTPYSRLEEMAKLDHPRKMISIEPIMNYTENFLYLIKDANPEFVAIGYDNYNHGLTEPYLAKTMGLIQALEQDGLKVYRKTLRERSSLGGKP